MFARKRSRRISSLSSWCRSGGEAEDYDPKPVLWKWSYGDSDRRTNAARVGMRREFAASPVRGAKGALVAGLRSDGRAHPPRCPATWAADPGVFEEGFGTSSSELAPRTPSLPGLSDENLAAWPLDVKLTPTGQLSVSAKSAPSDGCSPKLTLWKRISVGQRWRKTMPA